MVSYRDAESSPQRMQQTIPVHDIDHALGVGVSVVGVVGRSLVNHGLVNGVCSLVREDAGGQARDNFLDLK